MVTHFCGKEFTEHVLTFGPTLTPLITGRTHAVVRILKGVDVICQMATSPEGSFLATQTNVEQPSWEGLFCKVHTEEVKGWGWQQDF